MDCLLQDWVLERILDVDPFDVESIMGGMIRDQYQGGPTILTAISGVEIALWGILARPVANRCTSC